jgi:dihydropteroate synthase
LLYNVLVLASAPLPLRRDERRRLGLPPAPAAGGPAAAPDGFRHVRLEAVPARLASALAQLMRDAGGAADSVTHHPGSRGAPGRRRILLLGGDGGAFDEFVRRAARRAATRPAAFEVEEALARHAAPRRVLRLREGTLDLRHGTLVMGVLNVTPDSFSDGARFFDRSAAIDRALEMAEEGARLIDIGGESTRPGAQAVPLVEELRRVLPVLEAVVPALRRRRGPRTCVSIDTTKAEVARRAAALGIDLVNDISGMTFDPAMPAVVAENGLPVVIQHIRGTPRTMQRAPRYAGLLPDIARFLRERIDVALRAGILEERIIVDPGIGFGKRRADNLAILRRLSVLRALGRPILVGASRKSFIGGTLETPVGDRLEGSLAAEALAIAAGADIIRAHDVRQAVRVARLCDAVLREAAASG